MSKDIQGVELRVRYLAPEVPGQHAVFEMGGGPQSVQIAERKIGELIDSIASDANNGRQQAEVMKFLVVEAKKRAEKLLAEGETDLDKYWVSATDSKPVPGQALIDSSGK